MAGPRGRGLRPGGVVRAVGRLILLVTIGFGVGLLFGVVTEEPELLAAHLRGDGESVELQANADRPDASAAPSAEAGSRLAVRSGDVSQRDAGTYQSAAAGMRPLVGARESQASEKLPKVAAAKDPSSTGQSPGTGTPAASAFSARSSLKQPVAGKLALPDSAMTAKAGETATKGAGRWSIQVGAFSEEASASRLADGLRDRYPVVILPARKDGGRWRVRIQPIEDEDRARVMADRLKRDERLPTWVTPMEGRAGS